MGVWQDSEILPVASFWENTPTNQILKVLRIEHAIAEMTAHTGRPFCKTGGPPNGHMAGEKNNWTFLTEIGPTDPELLSALGRALCTFGQVTSSLMIEAYNVLLLLICQALPFLVHPAEPQTKRSSPHHLTMDIRHCNPYCNGSLDVT